MLSEHTCTPLSSVVLHIAFCFLCYALPSLGLSTVDVTTDLFSHPQYQILLGKRITQNDLDSLVNTQKTETLVTKGGTRILCSFPTTVQDASAAHKKSGSEIKELDTKEKRAEVALKSARAALSPSQFPHCLLYHHGYWTYEFCPSSHVRQFHAITSQEAAALSTGPQQEIHDYYLGKFNEPSAMEVVEYDHGGREVAFVKQKWDGGSVCELNGSPRTVEIEFFCNPHSNHDLISGIREVSTCKYLVTIHTPRLCSDPLFVPHSATGQTDMLPIVCNPIAGQHSEGPVMEKGAVDATILMAADGNEMEAVPLGSVQQWIYRDLQRTAPKTPPQLLAEDRAVQEPEGSKRKKKEPFRIAAVDWGEILAKLRRGATLNDIAKEVVAEYDEFIFEDSKEVIRKVPNVPRDADRIGEEKMVQRDPTIDINQNRQNTPKEPGNIKQGSTERAEKADPFQYVDALGDADMLLLSGDLTDVLDEMLGDQEETDYAAWEAEVWHEWETLWSSGSKNKEEDDENLPGKKASEQEKRQKRRDAVGKEVN